METMLIGNKYYERVAQPIISMERWEQHLTLIKDSIINDYPQCKMLFYTSTQVQICRLLTTYTLNC
ncbi:hypothetical protein ONC83_002784 [Listeria monocytogenes]|nr:hypothetical protein [Listeria monocytogenes]